MKKMLFVLAVSTMLLSSCGTYTGQGAYTGATLGSILGSAIGGISGGWHGSHVGEIVGLAGGAAVGAAIGSAADRKEAERYEAYRRQRDQRNQRYDNRRYSDDTYEYQGNVYEGDDSGFDATHSGDDRIEFDAPGPRVQLQTDSTTQKVKEIRITSSQNTGQQKPSFSLQPLQP